MPRQFSPATAEQVVTAVEAVVVRKEPARPDFVADFMDLPVTQAEAALDLAVDLDLLSTASGRYSVARPLCRFLATPNLAQRAAVLRVILESYLPFLTFRERLVSTASAQMAAQQTKVALELTAHREAVKDTLISLGTYSDALVAEGEVDTSRAGVRIHRIAWRNQRLAFSHLRCRYWDDCSST